MKRQVHGAHRLLLRDSCDYLAPWATHDMYTWMPQTTLRSSPFQQNKTTKFRCNCNTDLFIKWAIGHPTGKFLVLNFLFMFWLTKHHRAKALCLSAMAKVSSLNSQPHSHTPWARGRRRDRREQHTHAKNTLHRLNLVLLNWLELQLLFLLYRTKGQCRVHKTMSESTNYLSTLVLQSDRAYCPSTDGTAAENSRQ